MTAPQPNNQLPGRSRRELDEGFAKFKEGLPKANQLPEEVSERIVSAIEGRFRDWLMNGEHEEARTLVAEILTPYLAPRQEPAQGGNETGQVTVEHEDDIPESFKQGMAELSTLAPRPPAPRDAEALERWKAAREKLATQDTTHDLHYPVAAKVRKQLIAIHDVAIADLSARHAPADSASAQLAAITADRDEWKADSERLKAREVTLTDRQCLVQLAFTESGFNYESGEGLPELAKRVAGMASAYRARDNIGMSKEEYHKAKNALSQLAAMREENAKQAAILSPTDACDLATAVKRAVSRESELRTQLAAAQSEAGRLTAWKAYAESHGLHIALNKTGDCPEGRLAHTYREGTTLHRMFDEWSASIGWQDHLATLRRERDELLAKLNLSPRSIESHPCATEPARPQGGVVSP